MTQPSISPGWCSCDQVGEVLAFTACPRLAAQPWPAGPYCVGGGQRWQCRGLPQPQLRAAVQPRRGPPAPAWWLWGVAAWPASGAKPDKKKSPCPHSPFFSLLLIDLAEEASATAALRMDASAAAAPDVTPEGATRQFQPVCLSWVLYRCSSMQTARWGVQAQDRLSSMRPRRASMAAWQQRCTHGRDMHDRR